MMNFEKGMLKLTLDLKFFFGPWTYFLWPIRHCTIIFWTFWTISKN